MPPLPAGYTPFLADQNDIPGWFKRLMDDAGYSNPTSPLIFGASPFASAAQNTAAFNQALAGGGTVELFFPGTYVLACSTAKQTSDATNTYNVALFIPSNTKLRLGPGVILQVAAGVSNPVILQNSDIVNGNSNITIEGGTWDGNRDNGTKIFDGTHTLCAILIWLQKVTNLRMLNMTIVNPIAWGVGVNQCVEGWFENTIFNYSGGTMAVGNQGGYQFEGANNSLYIKNTWGNTYDDLIAVVTEESSTIATPMGGAGTAESIVIDGVYGDPSQGALNLVRVMDTATNPCKNWTVKNVQGKYNSSALRIGSETSTKASSLPNGVIDTVQCYQGTLSGAGFNATIDIGGSYGVLKISNVHKTLANGETVKPLIEQRTVNQVPAGGVLVLEKCTVDGSAGGSGSGINCFTLTNGTISTLVIDRMEYTAALQTGGGQGNGIQIAAGTTVTDLHVVRSIGINVQRFFINLGTVTVAEFTGNTHRGPTKAGNCGSIENRSSMPNVKLVGNDLNPCAGDNTGGLNKGVIYLNGASGTTYFQGHANNFTNGAVANIIRAGAEVCRWDGLDVPVPNAILTEAVGDLFRDSSNANNPYRCSTAPSTFTAL